MSCVLQVSTFVLLKSEVVHERPRPLEPVQGTVVPQSHVVPGQLICGFGAQGQPIPQLQHRTTAYPWH